jgi:hypothetical protein
MQWIKHLDKQNGKKQGKLKPVIILKHFLEFIKGIRKPISLIKRMMQKTGLDFKTHVLNMSMFCISATPHSLKQEEGGI